MLLAKTTGLSLPVLCFVSCRPLPGYRQMAWHSRCAAHFASRLAASVALYIPRCHADRCLLQSSAVSSAPALVCDTRWRGADGTEIAALLISKRADLLKVGRHPGFNVAVRRGDIGVRRRRATHPHHVAAARTLTRDPRHRWSHGDHDHVGRESTIREHYAISAGAWTIRAGYGGMTGTSRRSYRGDAAGDRQGESHCPGSRRTGFRRFPPAGGRRGRTSQDARFSLTCDHVETRCSRRA